MKGADTVRVPSVTPCPPAHGSRPFAWLQQGAGRQHHCRASPGQRRQRGDRGRNLALGSNGQLLTS